MNGGQVTMLIIGICVLLLTHLWLLGIILIGCSLIGSGGDAPSNSYHEEDYRDY